MEEDIKIERRIRLSFYNKRVLTDILSLANENPLGQPSVMNIVGRLNLVYDKEYIKVTYTGRPEIARRLNIYIEGINNEGSLEAMAVVMNSKRRDVA